jgi:SAM-dependent methyltransferase
MKNFAEYAAYYNALYEDKDYHSEAKFVSKLLSEHGPEVKTVLNFGCGTGKHDFVLGESGYQITGVDLSAEMVNEAIKNTPDNLKDKLQFVKGDFRTLRLNQKYDAVTALFHVMSYQNTNEEVLAAIQTARAHLREEGLFTFDFWYGPGVLSDPPVVRIKKLKGKDFTLTRIAQPEIHSDKNIVDVNYELIVMHDDETAQTINETHKMRYFFLPEMAFYLKSCSFEMLSVKAWMGENKPGLNTWNAVITAKAV